MSETKLCEQCHDEKDMNLFRKVTNQYTGVHLMGICKECYNSNNEERKRKQEKEWQRGAEARKQRQVTLVNQARWEESEAERAIREQAKQQQQARARELSLQANQRCPRCKQVRTDGNLWPDGSLHFPRYCENCMKDTPHSHYVLYCPLLGVVRYVGITCQSLNKRLAGHLRSDSGTGQKRAWIDSLRAQGLTPWIELIDEAPNEKLAKEKEQQWIDYYLKQGCPLTNAESGYIQRVLDVQSGRVLPGEDQSEDCQSWNAEQWAIWRVEREHRRLINLSAQSFRGECRSSRQLEIKRWHNRSQHVYLLDATYSKWLLHHHHADKAKEYDRVTFEHALSQSRVERQAALSTVTIAFVYWRAEHDLTVDQREDIQFLWNEHIPIIGEKVEQEGNVAKGLVTGATLKHSPLVHSFNYSVASARALITVARGYRPDLS